MTPVTFHHQGSCFITEGWKTLLLRGSRSRVSASLLGSGWKEWGWVLHSRLTHCVLCQGSQMPISKKRFLCVCVIGLYTLMNVFLNACVFLCTCTGGAVYACCPRHFLSETQHFGLQISTFPFSSFGLTADKHWRQSSQKLRLTVTEWTLWQMGSFSFGLCERNLFQFIERFCHHEYEPKIRVVKRKVVFTWLHKIEVFDSRRFYDWKKINSSGAYRGTLKIRLKEPYWQSAWVCVCAYYINVYIHTYVDMICIYV